MEIKDHLLIYTKKDGNITLRPPIGKYDSSLLKEVAMFAKKVGGPYPMGVIESPMKKRMEKTFPKFSFSSHRDYFDYVYLSSDLAALSGSKYSKIRNRLNKFNRNYSYTAEPLREENADETKHFLHRWCLWKGCSSDELLRHEKKAVFYSIDHFFELGLSGVVLRIDDKIEAVAVFERMNEDTAVVHYEKASPYFDGIYKAINKETAERVRNDFRFINRQEDMGVPGLRKAKQSYRPHHLIEIFHVRRRDIIF